MRHLHPSVLGMIYGISEIILGFTRRSGTQKQSRDRHSLTLLWICILLSIGAAVVAASVFPEASLPKRDSFYFIGIVLFVAGIVLRWWAIVVLGKFFTVDVAIAEGHRLIETGPYRFVRHPSYTGALVAFFGFGLCLGNWLSILCLLLPITAAFLWRIHVEEAALSEALGDQYRAYQERTKRLLPLVY